MTITGFYLDFRKQSISEQHSERLISEAAALSRRLAGKPICKRPYMITEEQQVAVVQAAGGRASRGDFAHPVFASIASLRNLSIPIEEMLKLCESNISDGPMLGECCISVRKALQVAVPYAVSGEITGLERKRSNALGMMDLLRFVIWLHGPLDERVATINYTWIIPRMGLQ